MAVGTDAFLVGTEIWRGDLMASSCLFPVEWLAKAFAKGNTLWELGKPEVAAVSEEEGPCPGSPTGWTLGKHQAMEPWFTFLGGAWKPKLNKRPGSG